MARQPAGHDRDDIVALGKAGLIGLTGEPEIAGRPYPLLGGDGNGVDRRCLAMAGLDLDEDGEIAFAGDDVDLAEPGAVAQRQNAVAFSIRKAAATYSDMRPRRSAFLLRAVRSLSPICALHLQQALVEHLARQAGQAGGLGCGLCRRH